MQLNKADMVLRMHIFIALHPEYLQNESDFMVLINFLFDMDTEKPTEEELNLARKRYVDNE